MFQINYMRFKRPTVQALNVLPFTQEGEDGENKPKFAKAGLPFTEDDVEEILSVVRYSYLKHETLVECAADPVMHEANAQHLVVKAFSARLAAYEPIHMGELLMSWCGCRSIVLSGSYPFDKVQHVA